MGFTHYWSQTRNLTSEEWTDIVTDISDILKYVQHEAGIPLGNMMGDPGSSPLFTDDRIGFNGVGEDRHETFTIAREATDDFCKTGQDLYDIAVVACLCYLDTCLETPAFYITSDGRGHEFIEGLELARKALPRKANVLDIPMGVMEYDRWTAPWIRFYEGSRFSVQFCINGKGYVTKHGRKPQYYCFQTHLALAEFLDANKKATFRGRGRQWYMGNFRTGYDNVEPDIWSATGSFDQERHDRIAKAQAKVLAKLFPAGAHDEAPPAYVRPMEFPRPEDNGTFCYYLADILKLHSTHEKDAA